MRVGNIFLTEANGTQGRCNRYDQPRSGEIAKNNCNLEARVR